MARPGTRNICSAPPGNSQWQVKSARRLINVMTRTDGELSVHPMGSKSDSVRGGINGSDELANMWQPINKIYLMQY